MFFLALGLDYSVTKEELTEIFSEFGSLADLRLVTYRNGHSKGNHSNKKIVQQLFYRTVFQYIIILNEKILLHNLLRTKHYFIFTSLAKWKKSIYIFF